MLHRIRFRLQNRQRLTLPPFLLLQPLTFQRLLFLLFFLLVHRRRLLFLLLLPAESLGRLAGRQQVPLHQRMDFTLKEKTDSRWKMVYFRGPLRFPSVNRGKIQPKKIIFYFALVRRVFSSCFMFLIELQPLSFLSRLKSILRYRVARFGNKSKRRSCPIRVNDSHVAIVFNGFVDLTSEAIRHAHLKLSESLASVSGAAPSTVTRYTAGSARITHILVLTEKNKIGGEKFGCVFKQSQSRVTRNMTTFATRHTHNRGSTDKIRSTDKVAGANFFRNAEC